MEDILVDFIWKQRVCDRMPCGQNTAIKNLFEVHFQAGIQFDLNDAALGLASLCIWLNGFR